MVYDRRVRYLDYCKNGERIKGGGFARTEINGDFLKLELSLKGILSSEGREADVILTDLQGETVLGRVKIENGGGVFRYQGNLKRDLSGRELRGEELTGLRIPVNKEVQVSCSWPADGRETADRAEENWQKRQEKEREKEVQRNQGHIFKRTADGEKAWEQEQKEEKPQPERKPPDREEERPQPGEWGQEQEQKEEELQPERKSPEQEEERPQPGNRERDREVKKSEESPEEPGTEKFSVENFMEIDGIGEEQMKQEIGEASRSLRESGELGPERKTTAGRGSESRREDGKARTVRLREDKWRQLWAIYPHIQPFHDERDYLSLGPADFVLFSEESYRAANNSFLLHGYYNYRHLILTKMERRGEILYYLGVPGNYFDREKQVAVMFGFESFECAEEPAQEGDFGYYMMKVTL